jgi:hypothetical protein
LGTAVPSATLQAKAGNDTAAAVVAVREFIVAESLIVDIGDLRGGITFVLLSVLCGRCPWLSARSGGWDRAGTDI